MNSFLSLAQIETQYQPKKKKKRSSSHSPNRQPQLIQTNQFGVSQAQYGPPPQIQTHIPQASYPLHPPPSMNQVAPGPSHQFYQPQQPTNPSKFLSSKI